MEWLIEAAKQVPALAALIFLVLSLSKSKNEEDQKSEERLKAVTDAYEKSLKSLVETLAANNQVLGSIQTLFVLVEKDLKDAAKRKP